VIGAYSDACDWCGHERRDHDGPNGECACDCASFVSSPGVIEASAEWPDVASMACAFLFAAASDHWSLRGSHGFGASYRDAADELFAGDRDLDDHPDLPSALELARRAFIAADAAHPQWPSWEIYALAEAMIRTGEVGAL